MPSVIPHPLARRSEDSGRYDPDQETQETKKMTDTTSNSISAHAGTHNDIQPPVLQKVKRRGLHVRFVTRMTGDLSEAVTAFAHRDGVTAGAWVRRLLLDRVALQSPDDARSGRPIRRPEEDHAAIAAAIRELGRVSTALSIRDEAAAKQGLNEARALLIPLVVRRSGP